MAPAAMAFANRSRRGISRGAGAIDPLVDQSPASIDLDDLPSGWGGQAGRVGNLAHLCLVLHVIRRETLLKELDDAGRTPGKDLCGPAAGKEWAERVHQRYDPRISIRWG